MLAPTQGVHLKQSKSLRATSPPRLTPRSTLGTHTRIACPAVGRLNRVGVAEPGDSRSSVRDPVDLHPGLVLGGVRKTTAEASACSTSDAACAALADTSREPAGAPLTAAPPCSGAKFLGWRGRKKIEPNTASLGQPSGRLLQQLGMRSHPQYRRDGC